MRITHADAPLRWRGHFAALLRLTTCCAGLLANAAAHASADCFVTAVGVNFGIYDPALTSADDAASTITVTCSYVAPGTTNVSYTVQLSSGMNSATAANRALASGGADRLGYNVFRDSGRTQIWANGLNGTVLASGSMTVGPGAGNGTRSESHTVYGRIPALQDAEPGTYADTLVLTLTY